MMAISSDLEGLISRWLLRQDWFPAPESGIVAAPDATPMSVSELFAVEDDTHALVTGLIVVLAANTDTTVHRICITLSLRAHEDFGLRAHLIGETDDLVRGRVFVYDGSADPLCVLALAEFLESGGVLAEKQVLGHRVEDPSVFQRASQTSRPLADLLNRSAETRVQAPEVRSGCVSVAISGAHVNGVLNLYPVMGSGLNPAVQTPLALTLASSATVQDVLGWGEVRWFDSEEPSILAAAFAMLVRHEPGSMSAWTDAVHSVMRVDSGSIGSYNKQAFKLGTVVGWLHSELAAEFGVVHSTDELAEQSVHKWLARIDWALHNAPATLAPVRERLLAHAQSLRGLKNIGALQRIHGQLRLNHIILSTVGGYRVVNFSADSVQDPQPPALDLVTLLRSVDYAAGYAWLMGQGVATDLQDENSAAFAELAHTGLEQDSDLYSRYSESPEYLWASQVRNSLLSGYSHAVGVTLDPHNAVLHAVMVDRLLIETLTELRARPHWLIVPLALLDAILGADELTNDTQTWAGSGGPDRSAHEFAEVMSAQITMDVRTSPATDIDTVVPEPAEGELDETELAKGEPAEGDISEAAGRASADADGTDLDGADVEDTDLEGADTERAVLGEADAEVDDSDADADAGMGAGAAVDEDEASDDAELSGDSVAESTGMKADRGATAEPKSARDVRGVGSAK